MAEYNDIKQSDRVNSAGRACYVKRNQWMLDESSFIVFFIKKQALNNINKGTSKAYDYAKARGKIIFNMNDKI